MYIDFKQSKKNILYQLQTIEQNVNISDNHELFALYIYLHKIRHDFLHFLILESLGKSWQEESTLSSFFDLPEEMGRKTPDIVMIRDSIWYIIDVSVSIDTAKNEKKKMNKYLPIVEFIRKKPLKCEYIHINLDQNYSNLEKEIYKINNIQKLEFDHKLLFRLMDIVTDKKEWVHKNIDKEIFEKLKSDYFKERFDRNKPALGKEEILLKELKYENIGEYTDLDLELETFKNFNSKFETMKYIEKSINPNTEEELIDFFGKILENKEDPLYQKYKDETLTSKQFEDAKTEILDKNEVQGKRNPKPSHHLVIPLPSDIPPLEKKYDKNIEQNILINFFKKYEEDTNKIPNIEKNDIYFFIKDIFRECLGCFEDSKDKEFNKKMFNEKENEVSDLKKEYKSMKDKIDLIIMFDTRKKFQKNNAAKFGYNLKQDKELEENNRSANRKKFIDNIRKNINYDSNVHRINFSLRDYCRLKNYIIETDDKSYIWANKTLRLNERNVSAGSKAFFETAGIKKPINENEEKKRKNNNRI